MSSPVVSGVSAKTVLALTNVSGLRGGGGTGAGRRRQIQTVSGRQHHPTKIHGPCGERSVSRCTRKTAGTTHLAT